MARRSVSTCPVAGPFGRYTSESRPIMLTLSFVVHDPTETLAAKFAVMHNAVFPTHGVGRVHEGST
jgi:hypothetical protein